MKKHNLTSYLAASASLLTFLVYLSSVRNEFVDWDDNSYVFENPHIRSFDLPFLKWAFFDFYAANWHPLTWISHALDYAMWGLNPMGHHLTNSILHAVNTFLVVVLVVRLIEVVVADSRPMSYDSRFVLIAAGVTGLLFGLHPIHVESVAWVAERKDLLCGLFSLLSVMAYVKYASRTAHRAEGTEQRAVPPMRYAPGPLLSALCFFILALLSKPMAVSLPLVLLILDWYPVRRITTLKKLGTSFVEKLPFFVLGIGSSILTILAQKAGEAMASIEAIPLTARILVAAKSLIEYLWKMMAPLKLAPFYPYPEGPSLMSAAYFFAIILVIGITIISIVAVKKQRVWLALWGYYVVTLIPVLGIVQVGAQAMADRYTYLPSIGPFLVMGLVVARVSEKLRPWPGQGVKLLSAILAILMSASMTYLTFKQIGAWKDTVSLWTFVIEHEPEGAPLAYTNRGKFLMKMGRFDEALADCNKAIALDPFYYQAYNIRGIALKDLGRFDEAIADYNRAIALKPDSFEAYNNRGTAFEKTGQLDKAIADYDRAIALKPRNAAAYANRGIAFGKAGLFDQSIESLNKTLEIDSRNVNAYVSRGISYARIGRNDRALEDYNKAIRLDQNHILAYFNRGDLFLRTGNRELAILDFQRACDLGDREGCNALQTLRTADK